MLKIEWNCWVAGEGGELQIKLRKGSTTAKTRIFWFARPRKQPSRICHLPRRKIENVHARNTGATPQDRAPKTECFPENDLAARKGSGEAKVTRTSYATWTALSSRLAKTRRTSVMISSLVLSASLRPTCKLMVFW